MLKLNQPVNSSGTANEEVYMILIYYKFCQDILSTLIYIMDLRKHGVTLYFLIDEDRKPVHNVPTTSSNPLTSMFSESFPMPIDLSTISSTSISHLRFLAFP
ncbi:hypothetical protein ACSBR2_026409 [Camellia fascicularis]